MSASVSRPAPPPGQAPLVAAGAAARLRRNAMVHGVRYQRERLWDR
jgi:hypothetical protein